MLLLDPRVGVDWSGSRWWPPSSVDSSGWIAVFSGFGVWGLALEAAITVGMIGVYARRWSSWHAAGFLASYAFGFLLLTWPVVWLVVGITWFLITGQSFGE